jgi:hypothetical protein
MLLFTKIILFLRRNKYFVDSCLMSLGSIWAPVSCYTELEESDKVTAEQVWVISCFFVVTRNFIRIVENYF